VDDEIEGLRAESSRLNGRLDAVERRLAKVDERE
jgi:hypothetical protein